MFENLDFNENIKAQISAGIMSGRLSHAVILEGADEYTRERAATEIAQAILCTGKNPPCGLCTSCLKIEHSSHPDLHILRREEKATAIKVDEVRRFKAQAQLMPNDGERAVFIIFEAQDMNVMAQNALLKIFEEPNEHTTFILTAASKSAFLETIISRGSIYSLSSEAETAEDSELSENADEFSKTLSKHLCSGNEFEFITKLAELKKDRDLFSRIVFSFLSLLRDSLVIKNGLGVYAFEKNTESTSLMAETFSTEKLMCFVDIANEAKRHIDSNGNFNLLIHHFSSELFKNRK